MVALAEIDKGYKKTDIGIIPEDWNVIEFQDLADKNIPWSIIGGPFGSNLKVSDYTTEGIRIIQLQNIGDGLFCGDYTIYTSENKANELLSCNIYPGEIILSKMGDPVARACFIPFDEKRYLMASDGIRLSIDKKEFNNVYVLYLINSINFRKKAIEASTGTTRQRISLKVLKKLPFYAPPKPEQDTIATVLSDTDELIAKLEEIITKKQNIKQGAMQQLLTGKKRLSGFTGEWEEKKLGATAILKARIGWQGLTTAEYKNDGDFFLITGTEFKNGKINWNNCFFVDHERYKQDQNIQIRKNDLLVTKDGTIGKVAFIREMPKPATLNSGVFVIRPINNSFNSEFLYYLLSSEIFTTFLSQLSAGSTINHLYQKDFVHFFFQLPPSLEEQGAIAQILSDMDAEIEQLEQKLEKYKMIKQGMMQELLTGKTRLL